VKQASGVKWVSGQGGKVKQIGMHALLLPRPVAVLWNSRGTPQYFLHACSRESEMIL
jgi:hypothetical protein